MEGNLFAKKVPSCAHLPLRPQERPRGEKKHRNFLTKLAIVLRPRVVV